MPTLTLIARTLAASALVWPLAAVPAARADEPTRKLAQDTVFEVRFTYGGGHAGTLVQPGFLVGAGGVGVTSYNAFHGASGATASFYGGKDRFRVDILECDCPHDLVLVRLTPEKEGGAKPEVFLGLAPGDLTNGQTVWTLQASPTLDEAKAFTGTAQLPGPGGGGTARPFEAPGWIFSEVPQDRRASGCPLVDEHGRVVGINIWAWPDGRSRPFGLTSRVVDGLLIKHGETRKKAELKGEEPAVTKVADARKVNHDALLLGSIFPRLVWAGAGDAGLARATASNLFKEIVCAECDGTGKTSVEKSRTVGRSDKTDGVRKKQVVTEGCKGCKGHARFKDGDAVEGACARAAPKIAAVAPASEGYDDIVEHLALSAGKLAALDGGAGGGAWAAPGGRLREALRKLAVKDLNVKKLQRGRAVMFIGTVSRHADLVKWERDVATVSVDWDPTCRILAVAPDAGARLIPGQPSLIVGVIAGLVTARRGEDWIVLDRVMAVPLVPARP